MTREAPAWLLEFQSRFGDVIRTPLDRASGTLAAQPGSYDARMVNDVRAAAAATAAERLAVYNRQYWFRLFAVMQDSFPLTSRLLGYWHFNDYAARFLLAHPPRGWDLDHAADGLDAFFIETLQSHDDKDRQALIESARVDAAWRDVFRAREIKAFRPSAQDAAHLLDARLSPSPAARIVHEHYPLLELRKKIIGDASEARVAIPAPLAEPRAWAIIRKDERTLQLRLEPREAELLTLLGEFTVRDALARLEQACPANERPQLPAKTQKWLARSVENDLWI